MSRPARILAVTVSAVLGVIGGVATGLVLADRSAFDDPLALGVPMVNQACTGQALLVVGASDSASGLTPSVADEPDARYLEASHSCPTAWRHGDRPTKRYVVYLGPFDTDQACAQRLTDQHWDDGVVALTRGATDTVQCVCHVSYLRMPTLGRPGDSPTPLEVVYIKALQEMLTVLGRRPDIDPTGVYDQRTSSEVSKLQSDSGIPRTGLVDSDTWRTLRNQTCDRY